MSDVDIGIKLPYFILFCFKPAVYAILHDHIFMTHILHHCIQLLRYPYSKTKLSTQFCNCQKCEKAY